MPFPPIADYAFLSNCEVNALVAADGSVEWMCLPRPDSPSVFGAVLDRSAGGLPVRTVEHRGSGPAALRSRDERARDDVAHAHGLGDHDRPPRRRADTTRPPLGELPARAWRPRARGTLLRHGDLHRRAGRDGGELPAAVRVRRHGRAVELRRRGLRPMCRLIERRHHTSQLVSSMELEFTLARCGGRTSLAAGESMFVALSWTDDAPETIEDAQEQLQQTETYWRNWLSKGQFPDHRFRPYIERSALALKGLSYAPTGAIMAAATTSLPETPGGERNWDYRYTWIRDSAFMLRALHELGFDWEALEYFAFVLDSVTTGDRRRLRPPDHVRDRRRARPHRAHARSPVRLPRLAAGARRQRRVRPEATRRVGNAPRLDRHAPAQPGPDGTESVCRASPGSSTRQSSSAAEPDQGIWEMRGPPQHFVASKVMCWVAADRGAHLAPAPRRPRARRTVAEGRRRAQGRHLRAGARRPRGLHPALRHDRPRRGQPADPDHGLPPGRRRARARDRPRDRRRAHQGRTRPALPRRQGRRRALEHRGRKLHDLLVLARLRPRDHRRGRRGRAGSSRSCCRSPDPCCCTRKRSTRPPASTSATTRRRSRTSPSSTPPPVSSPPSPTKARGLPGRRARCRRGRRCRPGS